MPSATPRQLRGKTNEKYFAEFSALSGYWRLRQRSLATAYPELGINGFAGVALAAFGLTVLTITRRWPFQRPPAYRFVGLFIGSRFNGKTCCLTCIPSYRCDCRGRSPNILILPVKPVLICCFRLPATVS